MTSEKQQTILVLDDDEGRNEDWKAWIEEAMGNHESRYAVDFGKGDSIARALDELHERRTAARKGRPYSLEGNLFDDVAMLFVDYDLFQLDEKQDVTGELVAYLARCYSTCGLIVAVNQFERGSRTFDLNFTGHPEAFADVHLAPEDLKSPELWRIQPSGHYRPWAWPHLPTAQQKLERRVLELGDNLSEKVLKYFGLQDDPALPATAMGMLTKGKRPPSDVDFSTFVESSGLGLRHKDTVRGVDKHSIVRIAAARLHKWLEGPVLLSQNALVDAPHLASRFPSLIEDSENVDAWNQTTHLSELDVLRNDDLLAHAFVRPDWLSRPTWYWSQVSQLSSIEEVADPWSAQRSEFVFCEDTSTFCREEVATLFAAPLDSPFSLRYIRNLKTVAYTPSFLLAV